MPWHCFGINAFQRNMSSLWSYKFRKDYIFMTDESKSSVSQGSLLEPILIISYYCFRYNPRHIGGRHSIDDIDDCEWYSKYYTHIPDRNKWNRTLRLGAKHIINLAVLRTIYNQILVTHNSVFQITFILYLKALF